MTNRSFRLKWVTAGVPVLLMFLGCRELENPKETPALVTEPNIDVQTFSVRGVLKEIIGDGNVVCINHEEIPDYMPAMTMPFTVRDIDELSNVNVEDNLSFRLNVTGKESWIDQIRVTGDSVLDPPSLPATKQSATLPSFEIGDPMPEMVLTNQFGLPIRFSDFKGSALALTFIYTRCPLPDFCPRMNLSFQAAIEALEMQADTPTNWHFLSISFDPKNDKPELLKSYAESYNYNANHWSFVTGELQDVLNLSGRFGLTVRRNTLNTLQWDHNLRTVVVDTQGKIRRIFVGNFWTPDELANSIRSAALINDDANRSAGVVE